MKSLARGRLTMPGLSLLALAAVGGVATASDCGHPPKFHTCTGGSSRYRVNIEENIPVSQMTSSSSPVVPVLENTDTRDNPTCTTTTETVNWSVSFTNSYKVGASTTDGVETQVGVSTTQWAPIAAEAKLKASSAVTITGELQRTETFTMGGSTTYNLRCAKHKVEIFRATKTGTASQDFADRVTCDIQGGGNQMITTCNQRTVKAKSDGTRELDVVHSETSYNCDCPPGQGDS